MADKPQQFSVMISCPNCEAPGTLVWEEAAPGDRARGPERRLISVHGEFHRESGRTQSGDPLIVCDRCDEILPD